MKSVKEDGQVLYCIICLAINGDALGVRCQDELLPLQIGSGADQNLCEERDEHGGVLTSTDWTDVGEDLVAVVSHRDEECGER